MIKHTKYFIRMLLPGVFVILLSVGCSVCNMTNLTSLIYICVASILLTTGCVAALFFCLTDITFEDSRLILKSICRKKIINIDSLVSISEHSYWYVFECRTDKHLKRYILFKLDEVNYNCIYDNYCIVNFIRKKKSFY